METVVIQQLLELLVILVLMLVEPIVYFKKLNLACSLVVGELDLKEETAKVRRHPDKLERGFTLVEILIGISILVLAGLGTSFFLNSLTKTSKTLSTNHSCNELVNSGLDNLTSFGESLSVVEEPIFSATTPTIQNPAHINTQFVRNWAPLPLLTNNSGKIQPHSYQLIQNAAGALLAEYNTEGGSSYCKGISGRNNIDTLVPNRDSLRNPVLSLKISFFDTNNSSEICPEAPVRIAPITGLGISSEFERVARTDLAVKATLTLSHDGGTCESSKIYRFGADNSPSDIPHLNSAPTSVTSGPIDISNPSSINLSEVTLPINSLPGANADRMTTSSSNPSGFKDINIRVPLTGVSAGEGYNVERGSLFLCRGGETANLADTGTLNFGSWSYCDNFAFPDSSGTTTNAYYDNGVFIVRVEDLEEPKLYRIEFAVIDSATNMSSRKIDIAVVDNSAAVTTTTLPCASGDIDVLGNCCPVTPAGYPSNAWKCNPTGMFYCYNPQGQANCESTCPESCTE